MHAQRQLDHGSVFGSGGFPLAVRRCPSHGTILTQHSHTFHELVLIVAGHGRHAVGDITYELGPGDVFVVLGDTTHGYPEADDLSLINILYDPAGLGFPLADIGSLPGYHALFTLEPQIRQQQNFRSRLRLDLAQLTAATELVAQMEEELDRRERGNGFVAIGHLMRLIGFLSRCYSSLEARPRRPLAQLSEVLGYMERHLAEPLTVADLTRVAHMSQTSLMRCFRQVLGRSPIEYLIGLRVSRARELLRGTDLRVTEIAFRVGFGDSNYFCRQFRKLAGTSPREWRRQRRAAGRAGN
jgi:AraC-like DNA-binding protein